jgi:hypothetical protein
VSWDARQENRHVSFASRLPYERLPFQRVPTCPRFLVLDAVPRQLCEATERIENRQWGTNACCQQTQSDKLCDNNLVSAGVVTVTPVGFPIHDEYAAGLSYWAMKLRRGTDTVPGQGFLDLLPPPLCPYMRSEETVQVRPPLLTVGPRASILRAHAQAGISIDRGLTALGMRRGRLSPVWDE